LDLGSDMILPFTGMTVSIRIPPWIYYPFLVLVLYFISNSVNLTDGVDGLCGGISIFVLLFFALVAKKIPNFEYAIIFNAALTGGLLGFLVYNLHPARVFMGDTGSLALGGVIAALAILMKIPWVLLIAGIIYILESLSVIIQVAYFKRTGKRVFKMSPIHHHFELSGWKEVKVVYVFWAITLIGCILSFLTLF
jgi:phospho-N-acetylmuramoyl-pentapeptide-transferase